MKLVVLIVLLLSFDTQAFTQQKRDRLLGNLIKKALENYHYRRLMIDDSISNIAFKEYLKRLDPGKQFLLVDDIKKLEKHKSKMDDQMVSGNFSIIIAGSEILDKRIAKVESWRKDFFSKNFNFDIKEELELDPDKRVFQKKERDLKDLWRKVFKQATLSRYMTLIEEQKEAKDKEKDKNKKEKKKVNEKKLSDKELREKARKSISDKYKKFFKRLSNETHDDNLEKFFNAIANVYDPHTNYLPPRRKEDFDIDISGSLEGIGAVLQEDGSYIKVVSIVPGGAAWRQKDLAVDDVILRVKQEKTGEEVDLVDMQVDDAVRYIRGPKGTTVVLTVKKLDGTRKVIPIIRDVVEISASFAKSSVISHKDYDLKLGYITVPKFYRDFDGQGRNCTDDVRRELKRLKKSKVDGVILDLRNNGGGALEDARQMSGLFIEKGPIVQIRDHRGKVDVLQDDNPNITYNGPLIVMVNRFSASASEILAAALQDYGRAVIVGNDFTHGKGTVQAIVNLNQGPIPKLMGGDMGALKVTIQKFYRIIGSSTQIKGVVSDVILPDRFANSKSREADIDNSLPWDRISPRPFSPWAGKRVDIKKLRQRSQKRVKKNPRFSKIFKMNDYIKKRNEDTKASLNLKTVLREDKENKDMIEKLKIQKEQEKLVVTQFEESIKEIEKIKPSEEKQWRDDFKQRKEEWVKNIRLDVELEEAFYIMNDMYNLKNNKKLSVIE